MSIYHVSATVLSMLTHLFSEMMTAVVFFLLKMVALPCKSIHTIDFKLYSLQVAEQNPNPEKPDPVGDFLFLSLSLLSYFTIKCREQHQGKAQPC